jgi:hypothetical protein
MANVLSPEKQEQVRALGRLGWSVRRVTRETGVDRASVRRYLAEAGIVVREPRRRLLPVAGSKPASEVFPDPGASTAARELIGDPGTDSKPASEVFPDPEAVSPRVPSRCEPHRSAIEAAVGLGRNAKSIWQELVDRHGFAGHYESVKRFVRRLRPCAAAIAHPRIETGPGEEAQVDYGTGPLVRDPETGKYRRTRLFALARGSLPPARRRAEDDRARQPARGRAHARRARPDDQPAVPRAAGAPQRRGAAGEGARP